MRKYIFPSLLAVTLSLSQGLYADTQDVPPETEQTETTQPREVKEGSNTAHKEAKKRQWQNFALVTAAVLVAGIAIYCASTNGGSHAHQ